jgi:CTP synthase
MFHGAEVEIIWIHSADLHESNVDGYLRGADAIIVPGGFGERGFEGKVLAARYAREHNVPYLGLCYGLHAMVVDAARAALGTSAVNTSENDPETPNPVITLLLEQEGVDEKGGTMRLGAYPCRLARGSLAQAAYDVDEVRERHRHRYEFNNAFKGVLEEFGLVASGTSPDGTLVEICEIRGHPFMIGTQFHPEFRSRPDRPHPLFRELVAAAREHSTVSRTSQPSAAVPVGSSSPVG